MVGFEVDIFLKSLLLVPIMFSLFIVGVVETFSLASVSSLALASASSLALASASSLALVSAYSLALASLLEEFTKVSDGMLEGL